MRQQSTVLVLLIMLCPFTGIGLASEKTQEITGIGSGELLLNFTIHSAAPVFLR